MLITRVAKFFRWSRWPRHYLVQVSKIFLLLLIWIGALVSGYFGFHLHLTMKGEDPSFFDLSYLTIQLIILGSGGVMGPVNFWLNLARFVLPALTAYAVVMTIVFLFREQTDLLKLAFVRNHVVICGLGRKGRLLVQQFRARGYSVVVVEQDESNDYLEQCRRLGAIALVGDASDCAILAKTAVERAKYLIAVCGSDEENVEIVVQAQGANQSRWFGDLTCFVHVVDKYLYALLQERLFRGDPAITTRFRIEPFNVYARGGYLLWQQFPAFHATTLEQGRSPTVLIVGLGQLGESLITYMTRAWWESRLRYEQQPYGKQNGIDRRLQVMVVDQSAIERCRLMSLNHPRMADACELIPLQMSIQSAEYQAADFLENVTIAYICLDDDRLSLAAGLILWKRGIHRETPIVIRMSEASGLARLLAQRDATDGLYGTLHPFGLIEQTCTVDLVLDGLIETLARMYHDAFSLHWSESDQVGREANRTWEELPTHLKESNRQQAERTRAILRAIDCTLVLQVDWASSNFEFVDDEVEVMARMEHEYWVAYMREQGYKYMNGPRDRKNKTHPDILSWADLPEVEKQKNRQFIIGLPNALATVGLQVLRLRTE